MRVPSEKASEQLYAFSILSKNMLTLCVLNEDALERLYAIGCRILNPSRVFLRIPAANQFPPFYSFPNLLECILNQFLPFHRPTYGRLLLFAP
jgi:hypothetical protein